MYGFHLRFPPYASKRPHVPGGGEGGGGEVTLPQKAGSGSRSKINTWPLSQALFHHILFGVYAFRLILVLNKSDKFFLAIVIWTISIHLNALTCTCLDFAYFPE